MDNCSRITRETELIKQNDKPPDTAPYTIGPPSGTPFPSPLAAGVVILFPNISYFRPPPRLHQGTGLHARTTEGVCSRLPLRHSGTQSTKNIVSSTDGIFHFHENRHLPSVGSICAAGPPPAAWCRLGACGHSHSWNSMVLLYVYTDPPKKMRFGK